MLLCIHIGDMGTFDLHEQIGCVSEGLLSVLICIHIGGMKVFFVSSFVFTKNA